MNIAGGTVSIESGGQLRIGYTQNAKGVINLSGGLLDITQEDYFKLGDYSEGVFNQTGGVSRPDTSFLEIAAVAKEPTRFPMAKWIWRAASKSNTTTALSL